MARNKFDIDEELDTKFDFKQLKRLLGYLKPYKSKVISTVLLMLTASIMALTGPYLVKIAIDSKNPGRDIPGLALLSLIFFATLVFIPSS